MASHTDNDSSSGFVDGARVPRSATGPTVRQWDRARTNASVLNSLESMTDGQAVWVTNFYLFAFAFSINMGSAVTAFDIAVFVLNEKVFSISTGLLFLVIVVASFAAGANVEVLGPRRGMRYAMIAMTFYFLFLAGAAYAGVCSTLQWPLALIGSLACGGSVAHLGAGMGPWTDRTASTICRITPELAFSDVTANILANYAVINYVVQASLMLMLTALQLGFGWTGAQIILLYGCLCTISILVLHATREPLAPADQEKGESFWGNAKLALSFYRDPRSVLLAVQPLAMGCMSSWKTAGLSNILKKTLGKETIGIVMIAQTVSSIVFAKLFEHAMRRFGVEAVMFLGALVCVITPGLYLFTDLAFQGWWIILFFALVGMSWAVYDTATRAVVLRHFSGKMSAVAFSSMGMESFLGGMVFYFMDIFSSKGGTSADSCAGGANHTELLVATHPTGALSGVPLQRDPMAVLEAWVVLVLGLLIVPCLLAANRLGPARDEAADSDSEVDSVASDSGEE